MMIVDPTEYLTVMNREAPFVVPLLIRRMAGWIKAWAADAPMRKAGVCVSCRAAPAVAGLDECADCWAQVQ
jgi:hypothetical protein